MSTETTAVAASTDLAEITLHPRDVNRVLAGHPWIYEGLIAKISREPKDGDLVLVRDPRQRVLGTGIFNSQSRIRVRLISPERVQVDAAFFVERLQAALDLRKRYMPGASSFRVVNSESDMLSGLIIDKYEDVLVMQISSLAMEQYKHLILAALDQVLPSKAILERNDANARRFDGLPEVNGWAKGEAPGEIPVRLNGLEFPMTLPGGHKTGLYLDQQANYEKVSAFAKGAAVLDCFSFAGGFGIHAARGGAASVLMLDQSAEATELARRNAARNGFESVCAFETTNVFDWLKTQGSAAPHEKVVPRYDLIILDPPSFTRTRAAIPDALRGYKEIHLRALKLLKKGGVLATFCCSHHVDAVTFEEVILEAAFDARRMLRRVASFSQSPDHPIIPVISETEYLKGYAYEIVR